MDGPKDHTLYTRFSTILILILKDIRFERGVAQGHIAQHVGKSPNAWTKIENRGSPLSTDVFAGACWSLGISVSEASSLAEQIIRILSMNNFYTLTSDIDEVEDELLNLVSRYFESPGFNFLKTQIGGIISIRSLNIFSPTNFVCAPPTVVRYIYDESFRGWVDNGCTGTISYIQP